MGLTRYASSGAVAYGNDTLLTAGETILPRGLGLSTTLALASGTLHLVYFRPRRSEVITTTTLQGGSTLAAGLTLCRWGIYEIAANGDGALVASIASDTTLFTNASGTPYSRALQASWAKSSSKTYALGLLAVGTTMPTVRGMAVVNTTPDGDFLAEAPRWTGQITGQTDLPASFLNASVVAGRVIPQARVYR